MPSDDDNELRRRKTAPSHLGETDLISRRTGVSADLGGYAADTHRTKLKRARREGSETPCTHLDAYVEAGKEQHAREVRKHHCVVVALKDD